ncbi:hypothetical protein L2E82_01205 [Cichorium intybus]|uniref:Uncharacterized protein n=1 Tax=Cichorium intybus TaxID=13427 RepID=A0ACB9GYB1_CICIN|nr:hypothetical protein L2E82_01205 [Cichorium intybus]
MNRDQSPYLKMIFSMVTRFLPTPRHVSCHQPQKPTITRLGYCVDERFHIESVTLFSKMAKKYLTPTISLSLLGPVASR